MGDKGSHVSSDRQKWQKIFNTLVHMLQTQQTQFESIVKERKILQDRIKIQYDRWVSDVHLFQDQISQMKSDFKGQEIERSLESAKSDLVVGLKQREAFLYKLKLELADSELADFQAWFDCLSHKCSEPKDISQGKSKEIDKGERGGGVIDPKTVNAKEDERRELRRLRREYEKLSSKNNSEVSALSSERNFVWNQYKKMESDYANRLKRKHVEVEQASEKIEKLLSSMEQLQSSNNKKDNMIVTLKTNLAKLEADANKRNGEISGLTRELELLRKSRIASATPVLNRCTAVPGTSSLGGKNSGRDRRNIIVKKEASSFKVPDLVKDAEKGCRSSKRKGVDPIPISETPKLFSSTFKVPKLKNSSPHVI